MSARVVHKVRKCLMDLGLEGAYALVQGGTQGMGRAAAECFADDGANVAVLARGAGRPRCDRRDLLERGAPMPSGCGRTSRSRRRSTRPSPSWASAGARLQHPGERDRAGGGMGNFEQLTDEEWQATIDLGAMGMIRCIRAALPLLRAAEWARIVNVAAHSTKRQNADLVAYTAAKAAVTSVTKNLSLPLAPDEILVNTVSPGTFATETLHSRAAAQSEGIDPDDLYDVMRASRRTSATRRTCPGPATRPRSVR